MIILSPVQYQKRLRLYEAQRLMLGGEADANSTALSVGYEGVSQFNRECKRLFGDLLRRNVKHLVEAENSNWPEGILHGHADRPAYLWAVV